MKKLMSSCTAMLVGKNATIDGSTIIARDEDGEDGVNLRPSGYFRRRTILVNTMFPSIMA